MVDGVLENRPENDRCTTIAVGPSAGHGGAMATHTNDCGDCDFRLGLVPAADWPEGSERLLKVYRSQYPGTLSEDRGQTWAQANLEQESWKDVRPLTGSVPQVAHTYALYEGSYAIMNEHQLGIGESTCAAKFWAAPVSAGGKARIEIADMTKIALERCKTARCAIKTMGDLATELGFYGSDWRGGEMSLGEAGEALSIVDKTEAWMFHVLPDDTGASAVWAAQRLQPDHVTVCANNFVIRKIDPKNTDDFLMSDNIFDVAERNGFWSPKDGLLDFLPTYSPKRSHPELSFRRIWRVFQLVAPSVILPSDTDFYNNDYPFSIKVRTEYDLSQGIAAGPFSDPTRFDMGMVDNMTIDEVMSGGFERAIAIHRTAYAFVAQARSVPDELALLWFAPYNPTAASFAPFYLAAESISRGFSTGSLFQFDPKVGTWELIEGNLGIWLLPMLSATHAYAPPGPAAEAVAAVVRSKLTQFTVSQGDHVTGEGPLRTVRFLGIWESGFPRNCLYSWAALLPQLITTYHDGFVATTTGSLVTLQHVFYPKWWLELVGYFDPSHGPR
ncbi:peptidase family C69-domain-containing protein [Ochromonadaceae sp. CCMP2298]|nr:peptidase family C69-domain-containing protein [Ochromonadaceae sp. CCMP2298]